jgi:hypothetical protein
MPAHCESGTNYDLEVSWRAFVSPLAPVTDLRPSGWIVSISDGPTRPATKSFSPNRIRGFAESLAPDDLQAYHRSICSTTKMYSSRPDYRDAWHVDPRFGVDRTRKKQSQIRRPPDRPRLLFSRDARQLPVRGPSRCPTSPPKES